MMSFLRTSEISLIHGPLSSRTTTPSSGSFLNEDKASISSTGILQTGEYRIINAMHNYQIAPSGPQDGAPILSSVEGKVRSHPDTCFRVDFRDKSANVRIRSGISRNSEMESIGSRTWTQIITLDQIGTV